MNSDNGRQVPNRFIAILSIVIGVFIVLIAAGTRIKPVFLRRAGAGLIAAGVAFALRGVISSVAMAGTWPLSPAVA